MKAWMTNPIVAETRASPFTRPFGGHSWWGCSQRPVLINSMRWSPSNSALQAGFGQTMRSEEHTSELQSLMRISYAVFCLKKKNIKHKNKYWRIHRKENKSN